MSYHINTYHKISCENFNTKLFLMNAEIESKANNISALADADHQPKCNRYEFVCVVVGAGEGRQTHTHLSIAAQQDRLFEPPHDKTNKMHVRPAKTQISLGIRPVWSESSLSAWRKLGSLATHRAHSEDSDQTGQSMVICRYYSRF